MSIIIQAILECNHCYIRTSCMVYANGLPVDDLPEGWYSPSIYYGSAPEHFCGNCTKKLNLR